MSVATVSHEVPVQSLGQDSMCSLKSEDRAIHFKGK